jgi:hypothetical protein
MKNIDSLEKFHPEEHGIVNVWSGNGFVDIMSVKQLAIDDVKKCKEFVKYTEVGIIVSEKVSLYCGHTYHNSAVVERCKGCKRLMRFANIKESDLEGSG